MTKAYNSPGAHQARVPRHRLIIILLLFTAINWTHANCFQAPPGLTSWWPGETGAEDLAGNGEGQTFYCTRAPGLIGSAWNFNGTNSFVRLPDNFFPFPPGTAGNSRFTFETWFQTTQPGVLLGQQIGAPFSAVSSYVPAVYVGTDGKLRVEMFWSGSTTPTTTTHTVTDGVFHHLAVAYDGTNQSVYLDTQLIGKTALTQTAFGTVYSYQFGVGFTQGWPLGNGGWMPFRGLIDEPAFYNRALDAAEVAALFAATDGKCPGALPPVITQHPSSVAAPHGSAVTLMAAARGTEPLSYHWRFHGTNVSTSSSGSLVLSNLTAEQGGPWSVVVSNGYGLANSSTGIVTVTFPLGLNTIVSNQVPFAGAGNLETSGAEDVYTFEAPESRLVFFDVITAFNRLFWSLTGPDGRPVFTGYYMPNDETRRVELPMAGTYRLRVYNDSGLTGGYSFQIYSAFKQEFTIFPGDTVTNGVPVAGAGNLEVPGAMDDYFFSAPGNGVLFFDVISAFNRLFWTLTDPQGSIVFNSQYMPNDETRRVNLPVSGTYRLRVFNDQAFTGAYSFKLWTNVDQAFSIAIGDVVTNGLPAAGAGNLESPGSWDDYVFTATPNQLVYFDVISAYNRLFWTLYGPDGSTVFANHYMPNDSTERVVLPRPGSYRLRVFNDSGITGAYSFRTFTVTDQAFPISLGQTVTNGLPTAGAGVIEMAGSIDDYAFDAPAGKVVGFQVLSAPFRLYWTLTAPNGATVFNRYMPGDNAYRVELPMPGTYHLRIAGDAGQTGSYGFKLWEATDQAFTIAVGDIITNGIPQPGAGYLEMPGSVDEYVFPITTNCSVFFDVISAPYRLYWTLLGPDGAVFTDLYMPSDNADRRNLPVAGTYRLRVYSDSGSTGPYSFRLWEARDERFNVSIGQTVTNGFPATGAGLLEAPGAQDSYSFEAIAGQRILFDDRDSSPRVATWRLVGPNGVGEFFSDTLNGGDPGTFTMPTNGTYLIHVLNNTDGAAITYSFALVDAGLTNATPAVPQFFELAIGGIISNGVPGAGAGNLEAANVRDIYSFTSSVGQLVFFLDRGGSVYRQLRYDVYDAQWNFLFGEWIGNDIEIGRRRLDGGVHYLVVSGNNNTATGTYHLQVLPVEDQAFFLAVGDTISSNSPAIGAGIINSPGEWDVFNLTAPAGQAVYFEDLGASPYRQIRYDVYDDRGLFVCGEWLGGDQEVGWRTLNRGGVYTVVIRGNDAAIGTYRLKVWSASPDEYFPLEIGQTVGTGSPGAGAGNLHAPGARDVFTFNALPNQALFFKDLGASPHRRLRYDVYDDRNILQFGEWLGGDSEVGARTFARGGTYRLVVAADDNLTGTYGFRILADTNRESFIVSLGNTITNGFPLPGAGALASPGEIDSYSFVVPAQQTVFFEDGNCSSPGNIRYDVYDENGTPMFGEWFDSQQSVGRRVLRGGTYRMVVTGERGTTGTYRLRVLPVVDQAFPISIGQVVSNGIPAAGAGLIDAPGVRDVYEFTAAAEQLVYLEDRGASSGGNFRCNVYDEDWNLITGEDLGNSQNTGLIRLSRGGAYRLIAQAEVNITGTYAFRLWDGLPRIQRQPLSGTAYPGQTHTFRVEAESPFPMSFQWRFQGSNLPGETNNLLLLKPATQAHAGPYEVVISNQAGAVTSIVATLTFEPSPLFILSYAPQGPVATNVTQFRVTFNSPVPAGSLDLSDMAVQGPNGLLDPGTLSLAQVDAQNFILTLPPSLLEGAYSIFIGPAVTNVSGQAMTPYAATLIYSNDFEVETGKAWSRATLSTNSLSGSFVGRFSNESVSMQLAGLPHSNGLQLTWDAVILDSWDGSVNGASDTLGVYIEPRGTASWEYTFHGSGLPMVQSFPELPDISFVNFGGAVSTDCYYSNLTLFVPQAADALELSFQGKNLGTVSDESWGVDNLRIYSLADSNGVFHGSFVVDKTGPLVTNVFPAGTVTNPVSTLEISFNEPIQPQTFSTNRASLLNPQGLAVPPSSVERLTASVYRIGFPTQRTNGTYTLAVGPEILDMAGNAMISTATRTFAILTAPVITTSPASRTVVRNNTVTFTVTAQATPPVQYQWLYQGVPLDGKTDATLVLNNVETNQAGLYSVMVTDAGGSALSSAATLIVLPSYGPFVAREQASRASLPSVPGNGVFIELYNGIGGGAVPTPAQIPNVAPSGTTLSPVIDFPRPGSTIGVGNSFNVFFQNTTTPPDQVLGLSALNFILNHRFFLAVDRNYDMHPETPEIDLALGVGSDDGFQLLVGTNLIGSASDRGFSYSWMDVSFEDEGLYPMVLLFAANAVGSSGLELSWQTGTNSSQIIPQSALYISPDLGDRLITFEEFPAGTSITDQYAATGVVFTTLSGALQITTNQPARFVPVSPTRVFGSGETNPVSPGIVDLNFVSPGTTNPATTDFVSLFLINAQNDTARVTALGAAGQVLFTNAYDGGGASQELVSINQRGIARVRIELGNGTNSAAIDNLAFLTPVSLPDLVADELTFPATAVAGQPVQVSWLVRNAGVVAAPGPWTDTVALSADAVSGADTVLASFVFSNDLPAGASQIITQTVILPAGISGARWLVVTANSGRAFQESGSLSNNTAISAAAAQLLAPDLAVQSIQAAGTALFGEQIPVSWIVRNSGTAIASLPWADRIYLSAASNSLQGAVWLGTITAPAALPAASAHTNTTLLTLPLSPALEPGLYYLVVQTDYENTVKEILEGNNQMAAAVVLALPPLPDLTAGLLTAPGTLLPGQPALITWAITNIGMASANGIWSESLYLSTDAVADNGNELPLQTISFTNNLAPGEFISRTQMVTIPTVGASGNQWLVAQIDRLSEVVELNEANNTANSAQPSTIQPGLTLTLPLSSVPENVNPPNLTGLVSRNGSLVSPLTVTLVSTDTNALRVATTVQIPGGQASSQFTATVVNDGLPGTNRVVSIQGTALGYSAAQTSIQVIETDRPALTLSFPSGANTPEGGSIAAVLGRTGATNLPLVATISTDNPGRLTSPATVTIPAGSFSATFVLSAVDDFVLSPGRLYTVTASATGHTEANADVTVTDNDTPTLRLTLSPTNVSEASGPAACTLTVERLYKQPGPLSMPLTIGLSCVPSNQVFLPGSIELPPGQSSATVTLGAVDNTQLDGERVVVLEARPLFAGINLPAAAPTTVELRVTDDEGPALELSAGRTTWPEGTNVTVTLLRNTPATNALTVDFRSSRPGSLAVPASVVLPQGSNSVEFTATTLNDGTNSGNQSVTIEATATNYATGALQLTVTDINLPDLVVTTTSGPSTALTKQVISLGFRIENQGLAAFTNAIRQRVYFSPTPNPTPDTMVGEFMFNQGNSPIGPGQWFEQTVAAFVPITPGDYWVVTVTDADNSVLELNEGNNRKVSVQPVRVSPQYTATLAVLLPGKQAPAGTPVPMQGQVVMADGQSPEGQMVHIHIRVRDTERVLAALARADGSFDIVWRPLARESGLYTVAASHPGVSTPAAQDTFSLLGVTFDPPQLEQMVIESGSVTSLVSLINPGDVPLSGLAVAVSNLPPNLAVTTWLSTNMLPGMTNISLSVITEAQSVTPASSEFTVHLSSDEGASEILPVHVQIVALQPLMSVSPGSLEAGVVRGGQKAVEFTLVNSGAAATGPVTISIPDVSWITLGATNPLPSLEPGQTNQVTLLLTPTASEPLGEFKGSLVVNSFGSSLPVPFVFRVLGSAVGGLEVTVEDEFTYYAAGAPRVTGATARLLDGYSAGLITQAISDTNGVASFSGVLEGNYLLRVTAPQHTSRDVAVRIEAGSTNKVRVLLPTETVAYNWNVVPTQVPDRYDITIETLFETVVPFPVVTATQPLVVPVVLPGEATQITVTLTNHGLLAAKGVKLNPKSTATYLITPLVSEIGDIPARGSVSVPVMVQLQPELDARIVAGLNNQRNGMPLLNHAKKMSVGFLDECDFPDLEIIYFVICGPDGIWRTVEIDLRPITMLQDLDGCIKAIAENAGKGLAGLPGIVCDCAATAAAAISAVLGGQGEVPKGIECLCAAIGLDPIGVAKCICFKGDIVPVGGQAGGYAHITPVGFPGGDGGCSLAPGPSLARVRKNSADGGVCAQVKLRLEQQLVLTRTAFKATLEIENRLAETTLSNLSFRIDFFDQYGQLAGSKFGIAAPLLSGFTGLDGSGILPPSSNGSAEYTIVPAADAAPTAQTPYTVGGELRYRQGTDQIVVTLAPVPINVLPQPRLVVDYFHQRNVFADDPFTDIIEPSIPYSLAVMLRNTGFGSAYNVSISSSQPKIIENEKGLLIDFQILGTELFDSMGYRELTPSLTANFGNLAPGQTKIGRWLLKSSLQGLFLDYTATFKHLDSLGNSALSLIGSNDLRIHEMIQVVRDVRAGADSLPDFLVNDYPAQGSDSIPTALYSSTGAVEPVIAVQTGSAGGQPGEQNLQITFTAPMPGGWAYLRVPDPQGAIGQRRFILTGVRRSDGTAIPIDNFWQTDRTFVGLGRTPVRENIVHLLDYNSTGGYSFIYALAPGADSIPPTSSVSALPANVFPQFPVQWSGSDNSGGPLNYDIYVSINQAPFTLWLQGVSQLSATYPGQLGIQYAFYSVASDAQGNIESPPGTPDAQTTASLVNTAPVLFTSSGQMVDEGETVVLENSALDADIPSQTIRFALGPGSPVNAVIHPFTGRVTWPTSELDGPTTNLLTIIASDSGLPEMSATGRVQVVIREVNTAPSLAPVNNRTINEGQTLTFAAQASDYDLPGNTLAFALGSGSPQGASVNPTNGLFTWRPGSTQGPSTNLISVVVTDNGIPPLSATQQFIVVVRDMLPDVVLSVGTTNVMSGESNEVTLHLAGALDVSRLGFEIEVPTNRLSNLSLRPASAAVTSASLLWIGSNSYSAALELNTGVQTSTARDLAKLSFLSLPFPTSAVVPLKLSALSAQRADGQAVARTQTVDGRVFVVATEPIMDFDKRSGLTVYGHPGATYQLQYATNLPPAIWHDLTKIVLGGRHQVVAPQAPAGVNAFYRLVQQTVTGPFHLTLSIDRSAEGVFNLSLNGSPGTYSIESSTNPLVGWEFWQSLVVTNPPAELRWTNESEIGRYFRAFR